MIDNMYDFYHHPEKYGYRTIGEVDWADYDCGFDLTAVFQNMTTGVVIFGDSTGCSCPGVFEEVDWEDMIEVKSWSWLLKTLQEALDEHYPDPVVRLEWWDEGTYQRTVAHRREMRQRLTGEIGELIFKVREATRGLKE